MSSISNASTLDGFPKEFVTAMRKLFDIMDDKKTGYVNLSDIENRWHDDGAKGLPKGVIESLRKVTPSDGLLSFERFCAGLKICLLRSQVEQHNQMRLKQAQENLHHHQSPNNGRPPSAPLLDVGDGAPKRGWSAASLLIKSTDVLNHRTISMPHLNPDKKKIGPQQQQDASMQAHFGPPKPPRSALLESRGNFDKSEIRAALQNWQIGRLAGGGGGHPPNLKAARSLGDGKASSQNVPLMGVYQKKTSAKRREPRRHTLQNGIDYNMLKRIKQIEQEKEVLVQGLAAIERAREWYLNQIATTQEKMKYLGRMGHPVSSTVSFLYCSSSERALALLGTPDGSPARTSGTPEGEGLRGE